MTTGAGSRRKGHQWERDVATTFRELLGPDVKRGTQTARGDAEPDVVVPGLWIECKRGKRTNPKAALRQAVDDAKGRGMPVAICKDDREEATATVRLEDFVGLVATLHVGYRAAVEHEPQTAAEQIKCMAIKRLVGGYLEPRWKL